MRLTVTAIRCRIGRSRYQMRIYISYINYGEEKQTEHLPLNKKLIRQVR